MTVIQILQNKLIIRDPSLIYYQNQHHTYTSYIHSHLYMGFQIQDYPHTVPTALWCNPQSATSFQSSLALATENNCNVLFTPIFSDGYVQKYQQNAVLNLDNCYILSDEHLKKYQLNIITPVVNTCLFVLQKNKQINFLSGFIGYASYLNLRYFAIKWSIENSDKIVQLFKDQDVMIELRKSVPNLIVIVETSGDTDQNGKQDDLIWMEYINFCKKLEDIQFPLYIQLGLKFNANLPLNRIVNRWKSQKISYLILSSNCFTQNSKGYAILPAKCQRIMLQLLVLRACFTFLLQQREGEKQNRKSLQEYYKFVAYTFRKYAQNKLRSEKQAINLTDFLQNPLQPYADNLESATYQVFENDEKKYDEYQGALQEAFETFPKNKKIILYYIGSGRGGLLFNVFEAAKKTQRKVFVYAIQKNLYPIQTIKKRVRQNKWTDNIKIVHTDIRDYQMPQKADIFLSQLLGGFGDNELSPQCLYWAQKNIAPQTICIPTDYVSYIRPVSYQYTHRRIERKNREIYYTVHYGNYYTNFQSKEVWRFNHPIIAAEQRQKIEKQKQEKNKMNEVNKQQKSEDPKAQVVKNAQTTINDDSKQYQIFNRYSKTEFTAKQDMILNGFAGYFTSILYNYCELSILPQKPTFGMYSWYPIFFCFLDAELIKKDQTITIQLWRKNTSKKIWYQWRYQIQGREQSVVHNQGGKKIAIDI